MDDTVLGLLLDVWRKGGFVMWFMAPVTLMLWFGLGVRAFTLRRGRPWIDRRVALAEWVDRARAGAVGAAWGVIDAAVIRAVSVAERSTEAPLRARLDEALRPLHDEVAAWSSVVTGAAVAAPLAGLLGTVTGMIETFDSIGGGALYTASGGGIGAGISEALVSTQTGLVIAVPGILFGALLARRQRGLQDELDQLVDLLCAEERAA